MSQSAIELVKNFTARFGATIGEVVVISDAYDAGDWEVVVGQANVISSNAANDTDISWVIQTAVDTANFPKFDACWATVPDLPKLAGTASAKQVDSLSTVPIRRWIRVVLIHNVVTASQVVNVQVLLQLKKRVP